MVGIALDRQSHLESILIFLPTRIAAEHTTCMDAKYYGSRPQNIARVDNDLEKTNETTDVAALIKISKSANNLKFIAQKFAMSSQPFVNTAIKHFGVLVPSMVYVPRSLCRSAGEAGNNQMQTGFAMLHRRSRPQASINSTRVHRPGASACGGRYDF
jgi:hypothetical protein